MKFTELTILLPCHSLEDFPLHHEGEEADSLLACWTSLWHPAFLASASRLPNWSRADSPPESLAERLLVIPLVSESMLLAGWPARAKSEGACVLRKLATRSEMVAAALGEVDGGPAAAPPELVDDFYALGFAYLQVELLTRQMRYMSNLDEVHFQAETVRAAEAAVVGDGVQAKIHLSACFEVLAEARERFYPSDCYLLDLTLCAATTLGDALAKELAAAHCNLLASAEVIEQMAAKAPASLAALTKAIDEQRASLAGGEYGERESAYLPPESLLWELRRGAEAYRLLLPQAPTVYGRRRFGLSPALPQLLSRLGFQGAIHASFEDGQFPRGDQSRIRWEGLDSSAIDALCRIPLDASLPQTFLGLPTKLGETMDLDHVAAAVFAHWPGKASPWYDDLRRACSYAPVLGKFVTLADFFMATDMSGRLSKFSADAYRAPYLKQSVARGQADPLSRYADHYRRRAQADAMQAIAAVTALMRGKKVGVAASQLTDAVESCFAGEAASNAEIDAQLNARLNDCAQEFAACLPRGSGAARGFLIANPHSFSRRVNVELPRGAAPPFAEAPVRASQSTAGRVVAVVDVPAMGFAWIDAAKPAEPASRKVKPLAEGTTLRNEHMEVVVDPQTGGIRAINDYHSRGNRLSQQLAFRLPGPKRQPGDVWRDPDLEAVYSTMRAESVEVAAAGSTLGEIVSRGNLLDREGRRLAGFRQTFQLWRGSQTLLLDIELEPAETPLADPWNSYYAARFAWPDEAAEIHRSVAGGCEATEAKKLEAPLLVDIRSEKTRTAIFPFGLPYHRRAGLRMLDTLLVVRGETRRRFRLGIGIDIAHPLLAAMDLLTPPLCVSDDRGVPKSASSSWLFHVDAKHVAATHWEPWEEEGKIVGFRARLLETEGKGGRANLRSFRPVSLARQTDYRGQTLSDMAIADDAIQIDFTAHEWVQIEAKWG